MKQNFFLVLFIAIIGICYGQKWFEMNQNSDKPFEELRQLMRKPFPPLLPPIEPIFPSVLNEELSFPSYPSPFLNGKSAFDRVNELLRKTPKIDKNESPFPRWRPIERPQSMPFFSSVSVISGSDGNPFFPLKAISEINDNINEEITLGRGSGLPVFDPKPLNTDLETEQNNNSSDDNNGDIGQVSMILHWDIGENNNMSVITNDSSDLEFSAPSLTSFNGLFNSLVESLTNFFGKDNNATESSAEVFNTDKSVMFHWDCPPEKHHQKCLNKGKHLKDITSTGNVVKGNTQASLKTGAKEVKKITPMQTKQEMDYSSEAFIILKELEESEAKIEEKDDKYFWYDYGLIASISGTSLLLCLLAVLLLIKRCNAVKPKVVEKVSDMKVEIDINNQNEKIGNEKKIESLVINM